MVTPFFNALTDLDLPREKIHLLIYNNTEKPELKEKLETVVKIFQEDLEPKFKEITLFTSNRTGGQTLLGQENDNFTKSKLSPIYEMWKDIKDMIKTDVFFQLEDDTIAPPYAFNKLIEDLFSLPFAGLVTGIETGRSNLPYQKVGLGVGFLERAGNKILKRVNPDPNTKGILEIDSCGVYCFAAFTSVWQQAFDGYDDYVSNTPFFGMDLILTNNIKKQCYKIYADFDVWCDHMQMCGGEMYPFNKKQAIKTGNIWIPEFNNYAQGIEIKT